jgi:ATP-dependent protease HslVU (ClpYQ) ATPase subunit
MRITLYKMTLDDDSVFYTNDRSEICDFLNKKNVGVENYRPYTTNKINSVLYNNTKKTIGFKTIERFYVNEYYREYIDAYVNNLLLKKTYTDKSLARIKNQYLLFINDIEIALRNNGEGDDVVKERIHQTIITA